MSKAVDRIMTVVLLFLFVTGLSLLLYPPISNYWNSLHQSQAITEYTDMLSQIDNEEYARMLQEAINYNTLVPQREDPFAPSAEEQEVYSETLNATSSGIMGYIAIPSIDVTLPVYHGTSEAVLKMGIGHLDWSSLPVGGTSSHCVLSGHRGLPSAKLFTNLDKLLLGDTFMLRILDEVFTYEVDQILIVEPKDVQDLVIEEGQDYCTLVTCTPYGINTQRLLVRGHRVGNIVDASSIRITADALKVEHLLVAPAIAVPIIVIVLAIQLFPKSKKKSGGYAYEDF